MFPCMVCHYESICTLSVNIKMTRSAMSNFSFCKVVHRMSSRLLCLCNRNINSKIHYFMFCCNVIHILATYEKAKKYLDLFLLTSSISTDDMQHDETENRSSKRKLVYANSLSGFFIVNIS